MIYARIEWFAANATDDDAAIRTRRAVGEPGTIALFLGEALHNFDNGETLEITVETVELQQES